MKERKKLLWKHDICTKGKFILTRKEEFQDKGKVDVMDFWEQKYSFSTQEVGRKMIFPLYLRNLHNLRNEEEGASALHKK